jgi:hypothetical protein
MTDQPVGYFKVIIRECDRAVGVVVKPGSYSGGGVRCEYRQKQKRGLPRGLSRFYSVHPNKWSQIAQLRHCGFLSIF